MEPNMRTPSERNLLQIANMAFGVIGSFRKNLPADEIRENIEWLEHALRLGFATGDPFINHEVTEAK